MYSRRLLFADLQTARCSPSLKHRARHSMGIWLGPARRTLQNPGQTEAATHDNPAIGRRAQAKPARQPLQDTFWPRRSVNGTCPYIPTDSPTTWTKCGFLRASMSLDVSTQPQPAGLFILTKSRTYCNQVVG